MIHFATIAQMQDSNAYLRNQIEQARLLQNERHQREMLSVQQQKNEIDREMLFLQQNKIENDRRTQAEQLDFDRYKFNQTLNVQQEAQREENKTKIEIANIQADSQLELKTLELQGNKSLERLRILGRLLENHNQSVKEVLITSFNFKLGEISAQNNHERQKELLDYQSRIKETELKLQQKHNSERSLFEHNARLLEIVIDSKLKQKDDSLSILLQDDLSYKTGKFSQFVASMVEQILGAKVQEYFDESEIEKAADKLARSVYSPY